MKKTFLLLLLLISSSILAQHTESKKPSLIFNAPYVSNNNRKVILQADRIPSDFLGCTLGVTSEVEALKKLNTLGIPYHSQDAGLSDVLSINGEDIGGDIECEGARFGGVCLWFIDNKFWKIVFIIMRTDPKILATKIKQKYSKFQCVKEGRYDYIRYIDQNTDLVHNNGCLQYIIRGGSCVKYEE